MFSLTSTGTWLRPLCTAMVKPTISGRIIERRDQVLIGRLVLPAASTFLTRWWSTNGPFLSERAMVYQLLRSRTMNCCVRLLWRGVVALGGAAPRGGGGGGPRA